MKNKRLIFFNNEVDTNNHLIETAIIKHDNIVAQ